MAQPAKNILNECDEPNPSEKIIESYKKLNEKCDIVLDKIVKRKREKIKINK